MSVYRTILSGGTGELIEKKSRFIAVTDSIDSQEQAQQVIAHCKKKYYDAGHHCFAYTLGMHHEMQHFSDDGEPSGTAGKPILDLLVREDIHNAVIVVTRYFGGTLLGTGGLVRAYQGAAQEGLRKSRMIDKIQGLHFYIKIDYNTLGKIQYILNQEKITILDAQYAQNVELHLVITEADIERLSDIIKNETSGNVELRRGENTEFALVDREIILFNIE
ncbi:MAG: YigZ family protein [Lachnospiraceae bacterium]